MALPEIHEAPTFDQVIRRLNELRFVSVRIGNRWATLLLVRVAFGKGKTFVVRMEVRDVDRLMRKEPFELYAWHDLVEALSSLEEMQAMNKWLASHAPKTREEIFEALLKASPGLRSVVAAAEKFVDEGHTDKAKQSHRMALSLKMAKKALEGAFNAGATRDDIGRLMDELLVEEIMES